MRKRKLRFITALAVCLVIIAAAAVFSLLAGAVLLIAALPVLYLFYKPLIPTPSPMIFQFNKRIKPLLSRKKVPSPKRKTYDRAAENGIFEADFYISPAGSDENDGSLEKPFRTFEKAKEALRCLDRRSGDRITVAVMKGEYNVSGLRFGTEDGGVCYRAYGGEAVLNGGIKLFPDDFALVEDPEILSRLCPEAQGRVYVADLAVLGVTEREVGRLHAFGTYNTGDKYDGEWTGDAYPELLFNGKRLELARYPDNGQWLKTGRVISEGEKYEEDGLPEEVQRWPGLRNPATDTYSLSRPLTERIASWKSLEDVWMYGYWKYDWADASTPIGTFDATKRTLSPKFVSMWGAKKGAPYYFFNVLEELTAPGEWYLDRDSMKLYLYPPEDMEDADIRFIAATDSLIEVAGAENISFDGFTLTGTRGDAFYGVGDAITVRNCVITNVAGNGIILTGRNNLAENNRISHTGKGGIIIDGGNRDDLSPGNSRAEHNLIHSWSVICRTYCPAVMLKGVGNVCRFNEMYDCPHAVIWFFGNNHLIEYNDIHDACFLTLDGGAIYAGKNWTYYGNVIRYNRIYDLGSCGFTPCGIYLDDALSGAKVYGNLLVNIPGIAIQLGGGRDLTVKDNIIINCGNAPISYDDRAREGALFDGWFRENSGTGGRMWRLLWASPYKTDPWRAAYPQIAAFSENFACPDDPCFVPNPGCSEVTGNIIVDSVPFHTNIICRSAQEFGRIDNNLRLPLRRLNKIFEAPEQGDYSLKGERKI